MSDDFQAANFLSALLLLPVHILRKSRKRVYLLFSHQRDQVHKGNLDDSLTLVGARGEEIILQRVAFGDLSWLSEISIFSPQWMLIMQLTARVNLL